MEPIAVRPHPSLTWMPEAQAAQIIIDCENGYGLSVINAKGDNHGFYCSDDTYEVCLIKFDTDNPQENPFSGRTAYLETEYGNVIGYLTIEDVGRLAEAIKEGGIEEYKR